MQYAGKEITEDFKWALPGTLGPAWVLAEVLFVQTGTFARFELKLRPELVDFHARGETIPAILGTPKGVSDGESYARERVFNFGSGRSQGYAEVVEPVRQPGLSHIV